ncbi:hypothetical protein GCM10018780_45740 [Streptomyces lanatus]|nr:hypothetical protein GCM10018780_45740 [Streptomyces lanatus]
MRALARRSQVRRKVSGLITEADHEKWTAELRDQGVIGAIGAGLNQSAMLARFLRETAADVVMPAGRYTLLDQSALEDVLPAAGEA